MLRPALRRLVPLAVLLALAVPAAAAERKSLVVLDAEMEGDLSDLARRGEWDARTALLTRTLKDGLNADGLYRVLDAAAAADLLAQLRARREVHACEACLIEVAERLGAERVLSAWVFRMSALILTLHVEIRDGKSGAVLVRKILDFRGDNDTAWLRAANYFVRWLREDAPDLR